MKKKQLYVCQCKHVWIKDVKSNEMCPNCSGLNVIKLKEIFDTCSSIIDSMFYENACALGIEDECY